MSSRSAANKRWLERNRIADLIDSMAAVASPGESTLLRTVAQHVRQLPDCSRTRRCGLIGCCLPF